MSNMRTVLPVKRNQPLCVAAVLRQLLYTLKSLKHPAQRAAFDAALCSVQFAALGFIAGGLLGRNQAFKCTLKRLLSELTSARTYASLLISTSAGALRTMAVPPQHCKRSSDPSAL